MWFILWFARLSQKIIFRIRLSYGFTNILNQESSSSLNTMFEESCFAFLSRDKQINTNQSVCVEMSS